METPRDNSYIGVATPNFREAANFYIKHFAYDLVSEMGSYISVRSPNGKRCLGFGTEIRGVAQGIHLSFLVDNAEEAFSHFEATGVEMTRGIHIGDWGAKHFIITDPAGLELYISEQPTV